LPKCGDGYVDGGEVCDDGNIVGGDGCGATCLTLK
jgi:cysteine-rich repeat protein